MARDTLIDPLNPISGVDTAFTPFASLGWTTAPAGGFQFLILAAPPAGVYRVTAASMILGTPTSTDINNMLIRKLGTTLGRLSPALGGAIGTTPCTPTIQVFDRITVDGTQTFNVTSSVASSAGTIYCAQIWAQQVG